MVRLYQPTPVVLPEDADLSRDLACDPRYSDNDEARRAAANIYDRRTIFYDIFVAASGRLVAIGPPLLNLAPHLLPVQLFVRAAGLPDLGPLEPQLAQPNNNCVILASRLPSAYAGRPLAIRMVFANRLEAAATTDPPDPPAGRLVTLSTLQRDNHPRWLRDWSLYHHRLGVDRLLLYDNGSQDFASICRTLDDLPAGLEVIVVSWDYLYGLVQPAKFFCRTGYLNHAHMRFAQTSWFLNLDVDEYLVAEDHEFALPAYLAGQSAWTGLIEFDGYWMPNIVTGGEPATPTVRAFDFRDRLPRGEFGKYLLRTKAYKFSKTHSAQLRFHYRRRRAPVSELAYFHYRGINTNWQHRGGVPDHNRLLPQELHPNRHVRDRRVIDVLRRSEAASY